MPKKSPEKERESQHERFRKDALARGAQEQQRERMPEGLSPTEQLEWWAPRVMACVQRTMQEVRSVTSWYGGHWLGGNRPKPSDIDAELWDLIREDAGKLFAKGTGLVFELGGLIAHTRELFSLLGLPAAASVAGTTWQLAPLQILVWSPELGAKVPPPSLAETLPEGVLPALDRVNRGVAWLQGPYSEFEKIRAQLDPRSAYFKTLPGPKKGGRHKGAADWHTKPLRWIVKSAANGSEVSYADVLKRAAWLTLSSPERLLAVIEKSGDRVSATEDSVIFEDRRGHQRVSPRGKVAEALNSQELPEEMRRFGFRAEADKLVIEDRRGRSMTIAERTVKETADDLGLRYNPSGATVGTELPAAVHDGLHESESMHLTRKRKDAKEG